MQEVTRKRAIALGLRTKVPVIMRIVAFALLVSGITVVAISYYKLRNTAAFKAKSEKPELSKEVTGVVEGYEQRVTKDDRLYLLVKASRDVTFSDNHHELENVSLAVYPPEGETPDQISASRAIYQPETNVLSFIGNVRIETKEKLKVATDALSFDQNSGVAQTDSAVSFERENVSGTSTGAVVEQKAKRLELKKDVQLTIAPGEMAKSSARTRPVAIKAAHGTFEQQSMQLAFSGGVTVEQEADILSGENLTAFISQQKRLERAEIRGNSYMRVMDPGRAAEVHSVNMDFFMDKDQRLERALASNDVKARTLQGESDVEVSGSNSIEVTFQATADSSLLKQMVAGGRSVITMSAPKSKASDPRAANKRLTANEVKLIWRVTGKDLEKAQANGDAELFVEPVVSSTRTERKKLNAPQFDCDFFEAGNLARTCKANGGAKAVLDPMQPSQNRGTRTLTSQSMTTVFLKDTQDVERFDAQGDGKFNENDRNGVAANVSYVAAEEMVKLRGGDPTVWDSRGRTRATELDADLANDVSYARGRTTTTYYSQEQTNGATPFSKTKSPVYIASERGEFRHQSGQAIYSGNARAWQDDNFVRGDKLVIYLNDKRMEATGHVQTAIYNAKKRLENNNTVVPVFAAADSMFYSDPDRTIHYESNVDIKQGTDRMTSDVADVYLTKETNEMEKTIAQRNVVLTQPNRKGTGDWVEYTSASEVAVLKGNPARVDDVEQGNTEGNRLTLSMREGKVTADDARGPLSPGRVRSTHKIRKP
ncbi:MAG TPA: LPS export ABC transporter periplasmic protein LptC [Pyrinomonadaceae bacterium]|jgi:lipopolysaccharide export system protein LptA|nr:LPS export ABC transporter periplasmic protein LptC [Pyrinomonadaceae bacterium]